MRALLLRDLDLVMRRPAFAMSAFVHVFLLGAFVLAWGGATDVFLVDGDFYQLTRAVQIAVLAALLPWTAARCTPDERDDDLVFLAAMTATRPSRLMVAKFGAIILALGMVAASGLPVVIVAQRMAGGATMVLLVDQAALTAVVVIACATVFAWRSSWRSRLGGWLAAEVSTIGIVLAGSLALPRLSSAGALALLGVAWLLFQGTRSDRTLRYLSERRA